MLPSMFTVPTEFSACLTYEQQVLWLYMHVFNLITEINQIEEDIKILDPLEQIPVINAMKAKINEIITNFNALHADIDRLGDLVTVDVKNILVSLGYVDTSEVDWNWKKDTVNIITPLTYS